LKAQTKILATSKKQKYHKKSELHHIGGGNNNTYTLPSLGFKSPLTKTNIIK